jgi:hypothetical protein
MLAGQRSTQRKVHLLIYKMQLALSFYEAVVLRPSLIMKMVLESRKEEEE